MGILSLKCLKIFKKVTTDKLNLRKWLLFFNKKKQYIFTVSIYKYDNMKGMNAKVDNRPIGMFDSGVGGLTVFKEVKKQLPNENIVYLGDFDYPSAAISYAKRNGYSNADGCYYCCNQSHTK